MLSDFNNSFTVVDTIYLPTNSADFSFVNYEIWAVVQRRVDQTIP